MPRAVKLVTSPTDVPVLPTDMKDHLRVDTNDDDRYIDALTQAATGSVGIELGRQIMTATYDLKLDRFEFAIVFKGKSPLQSVTTVKYIDTAGVEQTVATSVYTVDIDSEPGRVYEAFGQTWPTHRNIPHAVTVRFVAGYASASAVPDGIKHAIKLLAAHWHENREAIVLDGTPKELPMAVKRLVWNHRVLEFA